MHMDADVLYSAFLVLLVRHAATAPINTGRLAHALFLNLIGQFDPLLSARLHDEPGYRPFTVSPIHGLPITGQHTLLQSGQTCYLRITLLDGGSLWHKLCCHFLESGPVLVQLGDSELQLIRILSTPDADPTGWVSSVNWQTLYTHPAKQSITMNFASPTAFSWGNRSFVLFPKPLLLWESVLHVWNRYAPACYRVERQGLRESLMRSVRVAKCSLHTNTLFFPGFCQKGFVGSCNYIIEAPDDFASLLTTLAAFAQYAGAGYKTAMGMGQVRATFDDQLRDVPVLYGGQFDETGKSLYEKGLGQVKYAPLAKWLV